MKFFKLLFLAALSAIILTGCERQFVLPIDPTDLSQTTAQFAQSALSDLADTAAQRGFVDLANTANEVAEVLAIETGTIAEPAPEFLKLALEASALERGFAKTACGIELRQFAIASVHTAKIHVTEITGYEFYGREELHALSAIYPPEEPSGMDQALQNLAQEALKAEATLQRLPTQNSFIPFAFGYGIGIDVYANYDHYYVGCPPDEPGVINIRYDVKIRPAIETQAAVIEFLTNKGHTVTEEGVIVHSDRVLLGADVDPLPVVKELRTIPGVAEARPDFYNCTGVPYPDETSCPYSPGVIYIRYDVKIRPAIETQAAVNEFLINNGYTVSTERDVYAVKPVNLDSEVNLFPIAIELQIELHNIPGVAEADINYIGLDVCVLDWIPQPPPMSVGIIDRVRTRYNEAWCQGNFDAIDSILIGESGLDFFDYAFVRNLADIYAEEIPEDANLIQTNGFSLRPIGITFLTIYFQHSGKTLDEIIEIFRQTVRNRNMGIETVTIKHAHYPLIQ
ncbi:MAG: hypothetical protein OXM61_06350 [Candidatus Poribacteria bacterium]|nr:hypothetical protein [Candidatus Poribacteria bacterium]